MHIARVKLIYLRLAAALRANNSVRFDNSLRNTVINSSRHGRQAQPDTFGYLWNCRLLVFVYVSPHRAVIRQLDYG